MKYANFDSYILEEGELVFRSCRECNSTHEHLLEHIVDEAEMKTEDITSADTGKRGMGEEE